MNPITCTRAQALLALMAGDDLEPGLAQAVRSHVEICATCAFELAEHRAQLAWFRDEAGVPLDGQRLLAFRQTLRAKVAAQRQESWWSFWARRLGAGLAGLPGKQAVAGAAAMALILGSQWARHREEETTFRLAVAPVVVAAADPPPTRAPAIDDGPSDLDRLRIEIQTPDPNVRIIWFGTPTPQN